ncbi:hypothetical protein [Meiothermus sp.]|uniref:hypothetical protein n=1 Tax=Meiothermus sp. TaxID=1955249 RepID=UPI0021DEC7FB|nr:hypothetical protein [Meiothermus sp.]GIW26088.1 MAG: hypothetical protein KatS3mg069_2355 [Meiothermus sp.]
MPARAPLRHPLLAWALAGLVLLVSSQHALRDPRTQVLPVSFLPGADLCTSHPGSAPSSPSNHTHTPQQHCPLCILGGFSDGAVGPWVAVPVPTPRPLGTKDLQQPQKPHLSAVFPLLNRGPPQA